MRVGRAGAADALWLRDSLNRESQKYGVWIESADGGMLTLKWHPASAERPSIATG
jgi:hypothetical protein